MFALPHVATRLFGTPLLVAQSKLDVILSAVGDRIVTGAPMARSDMEDIAPRRSETRVQGTAVIPIHGTLVNRASGMDALSGMQGYTDIGDALLAAVTDPSVSGVLLELDTPGGEVGGVFDLADLIEQAKSETGKPIWALASESALSAGYLIASAADRVLVTQTGFAGSIGVVAAHVDQSKMDEKAGLKWTLLHAGEKKILGNSHEPLSDEARGELQDLIDSTYSRFTSAVARRRNMDEKAVRATEAGIFRGQDAVQVGLADGVSTLRQALADMAGLKPASKSVRASSARPPTVKGQTMDPKVQAGAGDDTPADRLTDEQIAQVEAAVMARHAELAEFAGICAKIGATFDLKAAIEAKMSPDAARKQVFDQLASKQEANSVSATPAKHPDHGSVKAKAPQIIPADVYSRRGQQATGKPV